jgi:hypothetical protein
MRAYMTRPEHSPEDRIAMLEHFILEHGATIQADTSGAVIVLDSDGDIAAEGESLSEAADNLFMAEGEGGAAH